MNNAELEKTIHGLSSVLHRYRTLTIFGWMITGAGFASLMMGWRAESLHESLDLALSCLTMLAGVTLVHINVQSLDAYVEIALRLLDQGDRGEEPDTVRAELVTLMRDISEGGWQEAFMALRRLGPLGDRKIPPPPADDRPITDHIT